MEATISSDSESDPSPGCSNWTDQPSKSPRKVKNKSAYRRIISDSDSEEGLEDHQTSRRSSRLRNSTRKKTSEDEENDKEEEPIRRSQRNKVSAEKGKKLEVLRRLEAKRAGKRLSDDDSDENENSGVALLHHQHHNRMILKVLLTIRKVLLAKMKVIELQ